MSHSFYNSLWKEAIEGLSHQINKEDPPPILDENGQLSKKKEEPIEWDDAFNHFADLYVNYIRIYRKLEDAYDQVVHPQKRRDIRVALETVMARLCQVKSELHKFGPDGKRTDFQNIEDKLIELKLSPQEIEIPIPRYCIEAPKDEEELQNKKVLDRVLQEYGKEGALQEDKKEKMLLTMTKEQAIRIIQRHERGRQGKVRAGLMKELQMDVLRRSSGMRADDPNRSASTIQRVFRGYRARKMARSELDEELVFIGMVPPPSSSYDPKAKAASIREGRKGRQEDHEEKYVEALNDIQVQLKHTEGPRMQDEMWDERYQWWIDKKEKTGKYPENFEEFYKEKELLANPPPPELTEDEKKKLEKQRKAEEAKQKKQANKNKKALEAEQELLNSSILIGPTDIVTHMKEIVQRYNEVWVPLDESSNFQQGYDEGLAKDKLRPLVEEEIRKEVDEKLLVYLENIRLEVEALKASKKKGKGKKGKGKKGKGKKGKGKKGKGKGKGKGKKGKKGKKCCDGEKSCKDLSLEDILSYLANINVLQKVNPKWKDLSDYMGNINYLGKEYEEADQFIEPSMQQIRECITEYCVLPMASAYVKQHSPLVSSLLLYGPPGTGKTHISRAIGKTVNATWFDLSPAVISEHAQTKADLAKLIHMTFTAAKAFAPAVIYVDNVETYFQKKAKKSAAPDILAKAKSYLLSHKNQLSADNRVLLVGNARKPYADVDKTDLLKCFGPKYNGKCVYLPCPNYDTRMLIWQHLLRKAGLDTDQLNINPNFNLSTLAFITEGYSYGDILSAVEVSMPERRVKRLQQGDTLLHTNDFVHSLSKLAPLYRDAFEALKVFTQDITGETEWRKKRDETLKAMEEAKAAEKGKKGKKKKK